MKNILVESPGLKHEMIEEILENPYDVDRDEFVKLCRTQINYFKKVDEDVLKQLYYRTTKKFVVSQGTLFDVGDKCNEIYIVLSGVFDIEITDGFKLRTTLDLLGKGSIIGSNYILK